MDYCFRFRLPFYYFITQLMFDMKYFHREGKYYILVFFILAILSISWWCYAANVWSGTIFLISLFFLIFSLQFFRYPHRPLNNFRDEEILAPADGKLVANEIIEDGRRQLSIFMSPLNVHANWAPISGRVTRSEYIPGKYLVAWHPKSSTENERHEVDILTNSAQQLITIKQIAGAVARRIICYLKTNQKIEKGDELGFIKFGSRLDVILPEDAEVLVKLDEKVIGNTTILARLN